MKAHEFLEQAKAEMTDRAKTYDKPEGERSMGATVRMFFALTGHKLTETEGWWFMQCLKMIRANQGDYREDNFVDGVAYAALAGESAAAADAAHEPDLVDELDNMNKVLTGQWDAVCAHGWCYWRWAEPPEVDCAIPATGPHEPPVSMRDLLREGALAPVDAPDGWRCVVRNGNHYWRVAA